jgi:hypothetical protein
VNFRKLKEKMCKRFLLRMILELTNIFEIISMFVFAFA